MIRLGLCCIFTKEPIKFRTTTATFASKKEIGQRLQFLSEIILHNSTSLFNALVYCRDNHIGSFRITSRFFPLFTHPNLHYRIEDLPDADKIFLSLKKCEEFASAVNIRLSFHPDPFIIINSIHSKVVDQSIQEIEYHAYLSDLIGADVINIHGGGRYESKEKSLQRLEKNIPYLSLSARKKLTLENDDKSYTPQDLLETCTRCNIPFVYDVHHHRCLPDSLSIEETTHLALKTWDREPLFHLSSPKMGWKGSHPHMHSDYIDQADFPKSWFSIKSLTIDVEAKAKELAVLELMKNLREKKIPLWEPNS